ncbi:FeS-binding protein [Candidatus Atribacteria bacterium HGW-Atribacteria-1]|nr:MAG: FeS-binding protein [Candidatus Atribacteria bacterium HGW-Atribacteria-1]
MNIENILKNQMCCGCGTCAGICPTDAIKMQINKRGFYIPKINEARCTHCKLCDKVCSQINKTNNFNELNKFVFGKISDDKLIGNYINCYVGCSIDENLRFESSSGGMITQILISALEKGIINGALVTRMKKDNPLIPEPFIARTRDEIISAMGSKYCPVPVNIALNEILNSKEGEKFVVVGLPCHILGVRKAELLIPKLKKKIVLHLGILCSGIKSFFGTEFILERRGIKKENVKNIKYRGNGWPGYMQVEHPNGTMYLSDTALLYYGGAFGTLFTNKCCISCNDFTAELSDISFGDAWNIEKKDTKGTSLLISRSKIGEELIKKLSFDNKIKLENIERDIVVRSQSLIYSKKKLLRSNINHMIRDKLLSTITWFSTHPNSLIRKYFSLNLYLLILIKSKITKLLHKKK